MSSIPSTAPFQQLKAANPALATIFVQAAGVACQWNAQSVATWCRKVGCDPAEFAAVTATYLGTYPASGSAPLPDLF